MLPNRDLGVDAAREVEDYLDHNEERRASQRERGDAGEPLHHYRQYRYNAEEERADKGDAGDDVAQICFCRLAGPYTGYKCSVFLQVLRYLFRVEGNRRIEVGKEKHEYKVRGAVYGEILQNAEHPSRDVGEQRD